MASLLSMIKLEEGWRERPYLCSQGYPTVGYGFKLGPKGAPLKNFQFVLPKSAGEAWLKLLLSRLVDALRRHRTLGPIYEGLNEPRRAVLVSMAYQLGIWKLLKFKNTLAALRAQDWDRVEAEMLDSLWARQTENRAGRHALQMKSGRWLPEYAA